MAFPTFEYLTKPERNALQQAFVAAGLTYDQLTREALTDGINREYYFKFLPISSTDPYKQLGSDLLKMNRVQRLTDNTIPLRQWLSNALHELGVLPERTLFETALQKVIGKGEVAAPSIDSADTPGVEFEEIITDAEDDLQYVEFLSVGAERVQAIAKLSVPRFENGKQIFFPDKVNPVLGLGTGWLIAKDLMMTNYHVIRHRLTSDRAPADSDILLQATNARAQFFFDADGQNGLEIKVKELVAVGKQSTSDFALLRLEQEPKVPPLPVHNEKIVVPQPQVTPKGTVVKALAVNIIQHPNGGSKRVALRNNLVYTAEYPKVHYFTDTLGGSSGSPVMDDTWRVVALHRAAVAKTANFHGKMLGYVNEGIQIHAILEELANQARTNQQVADALKQINGLV